MINFQFYLIYIEMYYCIISWDLLMGRDIVLKIYWKKNSLFQAIDEFTVDLNSYVLSCDIKRCWYIIISIASQGIMINCSASLYILWWNPCYSIWHSWTRIIPSLPSKSVIPDWCSAGQQQGELTPLGTTSWLDCTPHSWRRSTQ